MRPRNPYFSSSVWYMFWPMFVIESRVMHAGQALSHRVIPLPAGGFRQDGMEKCELLDVFWSSDRQTAGEAAVLTRAHQPAASVSDSAQPLLRMWARGWFFLIKKHGLSWKLMMVTYNFKRKVSDIFYKAFILLMKNNSYLQIPLFSMLSLGAILTKWG